MWAMSILTDPDVLTWELSVPKAMREDPLWRFHAYRVALFVLYEAREDARRARAAARWRTMDQVLRAVAAISANIAAGYGRTLPADRARFYEMALGSLRESIGWYDAARLLVAPAIVDHRIHQLAELRRMLCGAIRALRHVPPNARLH